MWPFNSTNDDTGFDKITEEDAVRNANGMLLCPRCESANWALDAVPRRHDRTRRNLSCSNCGYCKPIADGVEINPGSGNAFTVSFDENGSATLWIEDTSVVAETVGVGSDVDDSVQDLEYGVALFGDPGAETVITIDDGESNE